MTTTGIFISYRRDDSSGHAGRLFDKLSESFGADQIFMDIDTIDPGLDFIEVIDRALASSKVVIALIGRRWTTATDAAGRRRLDSEQDFVRMEVARSLESGIRVIPVLVQGATMPSPSELPPDLQLLTRRHAIELSDVRWKYDVGRLTKAIEESLGRPGATTSDESSRTGERTSDTSDTAETSEEREVHEEREARSARRRGSPACAASRWPWPRSSSWRSLESPPSCSGQATETMTTRLRPPPAPPWPPRRA